MAEDVAERARVARATNPFPTAKQAAFPPGLAYSTLKAMRARGTGPLCRLYGRTWRYPVDDLAAWSATRTRGGL